MQFGVKILREEKCVCAHVFVSGVVGVCMFVCVCVCVYVYIDSES